MRKISDAKLQKVIGWSPEWPKEHKKQKEILELFKEKRDLRIVGSVRSGKTAICAYLALREFLKDDRRIWILAPTFELADKVFDYIVNKFIPKGFPSLLAGLNYRPSMGGGPEIRAPWNSFIKCKSAENKKGLLGEELDLAIVDEAALVDEEAWQLTFDRLTSRKGKSVHISNPWGHNWWYREYLRAETAPDGVALKMEFLDNPYNEKEELDRAREILDEDTFNQKYRAMFLASAASLFRNIDACIKGNFEKPKEGHLYIIGVDWAKIRDFTVFAVVDRMTNRLVQFDRFQGINYSLQMDRLVELAKEYFDAEIWMDTTGLGEVLSDVLNTRGSGLSIQDYKFTGKSKEALFHKLAIWIEKERISFPYIPVLVNELRVFGKELTPGGNVKYGAPPGFHDDCVTALALATWDLLEEPLTEIKKGQEKVLPFPIQEY